MGSSARPRNRLRRLVPLALIALLLGSLAVNATIQAATPDLRVTITDTRSTAEPGEELTYTVRVSNTGTSDLINVTATVQLDGDVTFVGGSDAPSALGGNQYRWQIQRIRTGSSALRYLTVTAHSPLAAGTLLVTDLVVSHQNALDPALASDTTTIADVAPDALDDALVTAEDTAGTVVVLANDTDRNGTPLSLTENWTEPLHGTLSLNGSEFQYQPDPDFSGSDSFVYNVTDGVSTSSATVHITVTAVNDAPVLDPIGNRSAAEGSELSFAVSASDAQDQPANTVSYSLEGAPAGASIDPATGVLRWTPNEMQGGGSFTFTIRVTDNGTPAASDSETITIDVAETNAAPVLDPIGAKSVNEGELLQFQATASDRDVPANTLRFSLRDAPAGASIDSVTGVFSWTPGQTQGGTYNVTIVVTDDGSPAAHDEERVSINVTAVNLPPTASDDTFTVNEDVVAQLDVLVNDSDPDGNSITITGATQPASGTGAVACSATRCSYTPPTNYSGPASFTYTISDGSESATATVSLTVRPVNDAPVAGDDNQSTDEDLPTSFNVLANDSDADQDTLRVVRTTQASPLQGTLTCAENGDCTYTPRANYNGTATFGYVISDGNVEVSGTIRITVRPMPDAPIVRNDSFVLNEDIGENLAVLANDSDPDGDALTIVSHTSPDFGALSCGTTLCSFSAPADAWGSTSFSYTVTDGTHQTTATVQVTVNPVNDAPSFTSGGTPVRVQEDSGPYAAAWASAMQVGPANESVQQFAFYLNNNAPFLFSSQPTIGTDGTLRFESAPNAYGQATINVEMRDDGGTANNGVDRIFRSFLLVIEPVNDAPQATDDTRSTLRNRATTFAATTLLRNDSDADGDPLTVMNVSARSTEGGTVTLTSGNVTYTPPAGFTGSDSFSYTIDDGQDATDTAQVHVTVQPFYATYLPLIARSAAEAPAPSEPPTPPAQPDLAGSFTVSPAKTSFSANEPVEITVEVTNRGNAAAGPFWVDFYLNPSTVPTSSNIAWNTVCTQQPCQGIAWYVAEGLAPGQSVTLTSSASSYVAGSTIWSGKLGAGTRDLYLYVDSWNPGVEHGGVAEGDELNNGFELHDISVQAATQLAPSKLPDAAALPPRPVRP